MATQRKVDVVTIGGGWTAGILAWKLTQKGHRVVSIEQGPTRWTSPDFEHNHDSLRHQTRKALMVDLRQETWTWRPNPSLPSLPMRQYGSFHPGRGIGGASIHWTSEYWRFYPTDFKYRSHHIERYGAGKLPQGTTVQDWPVSYEELEPYFDTVDYDIGTSGKAGNIKGQIQPGGNPFEGPRSREYPNPPLVRSILAQMFTRTTQDMGLHPFPQPSGILSQAYVGLSGRPRSACIYCGFCTRFGCEVDAKASGITDHIPLALASGRYEIRTHCKVLQVNLHPSGLASGITYVDTITGEEHFQPADVVLITGYTLTNVRMLLLSRGAKHPNGIGNDQNQVGKNYTYQLVKTPTTGIWEGRRFNQFTGNGVISSALHDYNADNFDHSNLDFIGGASLTFGGGQRQPVLSTLSMPALDENSGAESGSPTRGGNGDNSLGRPATSGEVGSLAGSGEEWGSAWKENLRRNWDGYAGIGIQGESLPYPDQFLDLDPNYRDAWGQPLLRITYDFHQNDRRLYRFMAERTLEIIRAMNPDRIAHTAELEPYNIYSYGSTHNTGGAIMGSDPSNSVTNKYGQVWDTPNVFVTGAALYPQNAGMNPTATLLALTYMAGDAMAERYFRNPNELLV